MKLKNALIVACIALVALLPLKSVLALSVLPNGIVGMSPVLTCRNTSENDNGFQFVPASNYTTSQISLALARIGTSTSPVYLSVFQNTTLLSNGTQIATSSNSYLPTSFGYPVSGATTTALVDFSFSTPISFNAGTVYNVLAQCATRSDTDLYGVYGFNSLPAGNFSNEIYTLQVGNITNNATSTRDVPVIINDIDTSVSKIFSFSYSTTTAIANVTGYWHATATPFVTERLTFWQFSDTIGDEARSQIIATTTGLFNYSFAFRDPFAWTAGESSTTPIFNSFTLNASLDRYDVTNEVFPFGGTVITNLDATSTTVSTTAYNAIDFIHSPRDLALYPEYPCGITEIMGCVKNAGIWLFYPTQTSLDSWSLLKTKIETKAPIGYFYTVKNSIGGLSATSTPAFSLIIPKHLKQYFFDPVDIGISGILFFFFIFNFYKRLKHIDI